MNDSDTQYVYLPIGLDVNIDQEGMPARMGKIIHVDPSDENLPYKVEYIDEEGQEEDGWFSFADISPVNGASMPPIEGGSSMSLAHRLYDGFTSGEMTLADMEATALLLATQLQAVDQAKPLTARGICSACVGDVAFNTTTGVWDHADGNTDHRPPAIMLGA